MKNSMTKITMIVLIMASLFMTMPAVADAGNPKISGHLRYAMEYGVMAVEPVDNVIATSRDADAVITTNGKMRPDGVANKIAKKVKPAKEPISRRERIALPSMIGGAIMTEYEPTDEEIKQLKDLGVEIRSRMGTLTTVTMPTAKINEIADLRFVRFIDGAKPVRMHLDEAIPEMGAMESWVCGYTGDGVIIGIVDSGIDEGHGDFWFDTGKTNSKILYLWDQTDDTGPVPDGYDYGTEWNKTDIEAGICAENDTNGHGTHVAGIAASSGNETGNYTGAAPDAEIVFVKTTLEDADIIDGWYYIVERAQAEGKPCVISCSIGAYFDPHDGSDPLAQAANWCAAQGVLVICSAGNDGCWPVHATIQQPRTEIWSDDFESGFGNWVTDGADPTWHLEDSRSTSQDNSTHPGSCGEICEYVNNQTSTMTMVNSVDLSATTYPVMAFQLWSEIEYYEDYLYVDVSPDDGVTWAEGIWSYSGEDANWRGMLVDLSPFKSDQVKIRFRFESDWIYTYEGPYIDDVVICDQVDECGGSYVYDDTYNLEVALDSYWRESEVDLYYDSDDNVSIEVRTANGYVSANEACANGSGTGWAIEVYYTEGPTYKNYFVYAYDEDPSLNEVIEIRMDAVGPGGVNRWDAWMLPVYYEGGYFRDVDDMDYFKSVGSPATAESCIAVGAYTTKTAWNSSDGDTHYYPSAMMDRLAFFSSHGPTRDCRMKPEITASGFGIMSAMSADSSPSTAYIDPDGTHRMMAGTSMSAPVVAGAAALYLDKYPDASPLWVKKFLMENASREDLFTGSPITQTQYWGSGKLRLPTQPPDWPIPELSTLLLVSAGVLLIAGYVGLRRRKE